MKILAYLESLSKGVLITLGLLLVVVLGALDYATGLDISFAVFYLLPVALITWYVNKLTSILFSFISAVTWSAVNFMMQQQPSSYPHIFIFMWNATTRLGFFIIVALTLSALRNALDREKSLARTDYLTDASNSRAFFEIAELELHRSRRYKHPLTVMYIDADNFKTVNDQYGHDVGDRVLRIIVDTMKNHLRIHDVIARLGGDEFVVLLPETSPEAARSVCEKIQHHLLNEMQQHQWPITFSIGVLTYIEPPATIHEMITRADNLMYTVKNAGKNAIKHEVFNPLPYAITQPDKNSLKV